MRKLPGPAANLSPTEEENPGQSFEKPAPIYQWVYRPEFQYSLYDLSIDKINRYEKTLPTVKTSSGNATDHYLIR